MYIYHIEESIRKNFIGYSLDLFLFNNPKIKTLVVQYLKYTDKVVNYKYLLNLFENIDSLDYLESDDHEKLMNNDEVYNRIIKKYIRNKYIWCDILCKLQPYFFDAKYLLIGQYQKVAQECANNFFHKQTMHYSGLVNTIRESQNNIDKFNKFFNSKIELENKYFDILISKELQNDQRFITYIYNNYIEIYDQKSELVLQFNLKFNGEHEVNILFTKIKKNRSKRESNRLSLNMIARNESIRKLYNYLTIDGYLEINNYLTKLDELKNNNEYKVLKETVKQILIDLDNQEECVYFDKPRIDAYLIHKNIVEKTRINISNRNKILRVQRNVNFNEKVLELASYMTFNNFDLNADFLLMSGIINIGHYLKSHNLYEYLLLSNGKNNNFSLSFMKSTIMDSKDEFHRYEVLQIGLKRDINYHLDNDIKIEDTRVPNKIDKDFNIQFESYAFDKNNEKFRIERPELLKRKNKLTKEFSNKIKKYIN